MKSGLTPNTPKRRFANDGSLESVDAMLIKMATVFYPRVMAMGLPMEFDDVLQELRMAYCKAREKWNPEKAQFNTYCYTVARNEFNRRIERMVTDRDRLGMSSIDNYLSDSSENQDLGDGYERYMSEESEGSMPCERIERRQVLREQLDKLTPHTRAVVATLIANESQRNTPMMTLNDIAVHLGLAKPAVEVVRKELNSVFGVLLSFSPRRKSKSA